jgi:hypothetical protein
MCLQIMGKCRLNRFSRSDNATLGSGTFSSSEIAREASAYSFGIAGFCCAADMAIARVTGA